MMIPQWSSQSPASEHDTRPLLKSVLLLTLLMSPLACDQGSNSNGNSITQVRTFATTYGTLGEDRILHIEPTYDFGRIVSGITDHYGDGRSDGWLMKQDIDGNVEWSRSYGDGALDLVGNEGINWSANEAMDSHKIDVVSTDDGGCIVVGARFIETVSDRDVSGPVWHPMAMRLNSSGRVVWRRELQGGGRGGRFLSVRREEFADDYFVVGYAEEAGFNLDGRNRDILIVSLSGDGDVRWERTLGGPEHEVATAFDFVSSGLGSPPFALSIVGNRTRGGGPDGNVGIFYQIENEQAGAILAEVTVDLDRGVNLLDVIREPLTGNFVAVGTRKGNKNDYYTSRDNSLDILLVKFDDSDGTVQWEERFEVAEGFNSGDYAFALTPGVLDRGFFVVGYGGVLSRDAIVLFVDADGDVNRSASAQFGSDSTREEFHTIQRTISESLLVGGSADDAPWAGVLGINLEFEWDRTYDIPGVSGKVYAAEESFRGGAAVGYFLSGTGPSGGWLMNIDRIGNPRWVRSLNEDTRDEIYAVHQTDDDNDGVRDDGFIALGTSGSPLWQEKDAWLLKVDSEGDVQWQRRIGVTGVDDFGVALQPTASGFVVGGSTRNENFGGDLLLQSFQSDGSLIWQRVFQHPEAQSIEALEVGPDGSIYFAAGSEFGGVVGKVLVNGADDPTWQTVRLSFKPRAIALDLTLNRVAAAGVYATSTKELAAITIDANGTILRQFAYPGANAPNPDDGAFSLVSRDGEYLVASNTRSIALTGERCEDEEGDFVPCGNIHLLHLDSELAILAEQTYSNVYEDKVRSMAFAEDGTLLLGGSTDTRFLNTGDFPRGEDGWILKMEVNGFIAPDCPSYGEIALSAPRAIRPEGNTTLGFGTGTGIYVEDTDLLSFNDERQLVVDTLCKTRSQEYTLNVQIEGAGRVIDPRHRIDCRSSCEQSIREGLPIRLEAIADDGAEFLGWSEECPTGNFSMVSNTSCVARFSGEGSGGGGGSSDFSGYWQVDFVCEQDCELDDPSILEGTDTVMISLNGNQATIENFTNNQIYQGTLSGNVLSWFGTYTFQGAEWEESGTYTLEENGTFTLSSRYAFIRDGDSCFGTCTGVGTRAGG